MTLRLNGSTSGYTEIDAPAVAGNNTLILPGGNGAAGQVLSTNGSGTLSWADRGRMVLETAKASTSGTSIDFTGIPSWVKKITVMFSGVSTSGSSDVIVQLGTGSGVTTTGYVAAGSYVSAANYAYAAYTTGLGIRDSTSSGLRHGAMFVVNVTGNVWSSAHNIIDTINGVTAQGGGSVTLSGTLDRVRITTVNGTDTFDAGSINILYEG